MGLLDMLTGSSDDATGKSGGLSKMDLALMALLAYRTWQGKGRLADMFGRKSTDEGATPQADAPSRGSLEDILGGLLGGGAATPAPSGTGSRTIPVNAPAGEASGQGAGGLGGLGGLLGGLLAGGAAGSVLSGGLNDLLKQLQQGGLEEQAKSWVGTGENQPVDPSDLEQALGSDTVQSIAEQVGLSKGELMQGLSQRLPETVNSLTPQGRLPDGSSWV